MAGGVVEKMPSDVSWRRVFYNLLLFNYSGSCTKSVFKKGVHCFA